MTDFDAPPVYDIVLKNDGRFTPPLESYFTYTWQNLTSFLSASGVFLPPLTTSQRDAITSPQNGQMIYNSTLDQPQMRVAGAWKTIVTM